jgi:transcriptional regulator with XRE-family HTH domain
MTFGEKLSQLRKENNYTQEQFGELMGVSRQTVSKWESDIAYPETDKLVKIGELFGCSMDYLLKNDVTDKNSTSSENTDNKDNTNNIVFNFGNFQIKERKSEKTVLGLVSTCELIRYIDEFNPPVQYTSKSQKGQASFFVCDWQEMRKCGINVTLITEKDCKCVATGFTADGVEVNKEFSIEKLCA